MQILCLDDSRLLKECFIHMLSVVQKTNTNATPKSSEDLKPSNKIEGIVLPEIYEFLGLVAKQTAVFGLQVDFWKLDKTCNLSFLLENKA